MLSLCMIVKNEEATLGFCLDAVKSYVDQIVIVDTGSTDETKNIAQKYTEDVFDFQWCNDFSAARNFSLSHAAHDWVLILDADEVVVDFNLESLRASIKNNPQKVGRIKRINPFESNGSTQKFVERVNRLFNRHFFEYSGLIHEQVVRKDQKKYSTFHVDIAVNHEGYTKEVLNRTKKLTRNIEMLKMALLEKPKDPYLHYQLGKSHYMSKLYEDAYQNFSAALKLKPDLQFEYVKDLVESYGYAMINTNRYQEAITLEKYADYYAISPEYNFLMGLIYMNNALFSKAIDSFKRCLVDGEYSIDGINSYQPLYNIGVIHEVLGDKYKAISFYKQAKDYSVSKARIKEMKNQLIKKYDAELKSILDDLNEGLIEQADLKISILKDIKLTSDLIFYEGMVNLIRGDYKESIKQFKAVCEENASNFDALFNLAFAYIQVNRHEDAKNCLDFILKNTKEKDIREEAQSLLKEHDL